MVTIYTTPTCTYCKQAKRFFDERSVKYTEIDVSEDVAAQQELVRKTGQMGVPVSVIGRTIIVGFNTEAIERALRDAENA